MDDYSVLNTPMRKIRDLSLHSPTQLSLSPVRYPSMSDFAIKLDFISESMLSKGYSQTLSNSVLRELDTRVNEINVKLSPKMSSKATAARRKRFSGIHKPLFQNMESISSHYAASRLNESPDRNTDISSSATKKRRTLNGPEEIFAGIGDDVSPTRLRGPTGKTLSTEHPSYQFAKSTPGSLPPLQRDSSLAAPAKSSIPSSPIQMSISSRSSPVRTPRISPSKGSMNLNKLLLDDSGFVKPESPVRERPSSLQMAGVKPFDGSFTRHADSSRSLHKQPSQSSLAHKKSSSNLQKRPSIPQLQPRLAIPNLLKKPSIPSLQHKLSISDLHKSSSNLQKPPFNLQQKPSFQQSSTLQHKLSFSNLQKKPLIPSLNRKPSIPILEKKASSNSLRQPLKHSEPVSHNTGLTRPRNEQSGSMAPPTAKKITTPQPFSLYNKPTISSSQKSLASQNSMQSHMSQTSLSLQASDKKFNRFQKFKSRFS